MGPRDSLYINGTLKRSGFKIFIDNASEGKDICVFGDKNLSRDVAHVKDVAHMFYIAMQSEDTYGLYKLLQVRVLLYNNKQKLLLNYGRQVQNVYQK